MNTFENLSKTEQQEFLKFPVYISLLAANQDGDTDEKEKQTAIAFDHMKTYAATMHQSMKSFKEHVSRAHWNFLEAFIFPVPIKGLTY